MGSLGSKNPSDKCLHDRKKQSEEEMENMNTSGSTDSILNVNCCLGRRLIF